jgi:hypothetical protein
MRHGWRGGTRTTVTSIATTPLDLPNVFGDHEAFQPNGELLLFKTATDLH